MFSIIAHSIHFACSVGLIIGIIYTATLLDFQHSPEPSGDWAG